MDYDLGAYTRPVTTSSAKAQAYFDQGLMWCYGFNHEEAIVCFESAIDADPECVMAHWGIAYAIGPHYNRAWETYDLAERQEVLDKAHSAISNAQSFPNNCSAAEAELIAALAKRYPNDASVEEFTEWTDAFADAMREVHRKYPDDLDICALFAEAMMNRTPWQLWDLNSGKVAQGADTEEIIKVIETALANVDNAWDHAGLLHLYIHVMEMSPHPERALKHGDKLRELVPESGHLLHMPTHIDVLCGRYEEVVERNSEAIVANRKYFSHRGGDNFYTFYRCHDYHFKVYGAMFLACPTDALETADELIETLPEEAIRSLADFLECFVSVKLHAQIRFGLWQEILDTPLPSDVELYCYTTAVQHYARAVAFANLHRLDEAESEVKLFASARTKIPESLMVLNNTSEAILEVAQHMMLGEVEYHKGNHELAFDHLRKAINLDDNLDYDEPWGWMQPVRHALGALLIEQGQYEEAEALYRADLGLDDTLSRPCQHPGNVWSLHGLHECLAHRGDTEELPRIKQELDKMMKLAEVPIRASCYCRSAA